MSKASTKPARGTRDLLPEDIVRRRHVVGVIEAIYERAGFQPLETPAFENLPTLLGKYGEEGDQLLFRLLHRRDTLARALERDHLQEADLADLGLRYDLTVPLARVIAEHRDLPRFFKRYQIQPVWRADRPGRGRYREFYQCDVDIVGTPSLLAEAEVCGAVCQVLERLGFGDFILRINHRALLRALILSAGIAEEAETPALVALDKLDKVGRDGVIEELCERGIDRGAATHLIELTETEAAGGTDAPDDHALLVALRERLVSEEGRAAVDELIQLRELLAATPVGQRARFSPDLARGLSYYTGAIFEINVADLPGSLGGGGRYDNLIGMFGKHPIPAVGCSLGLERILLVMQERHMYPALSAGPDVMLCWVDVPEPLVLDVAAKLREQGLRVDVFPQRAKLKKQLQYADSTGVNAPVAAILGSAEHAAGQVQLKHLATGTQRTVVIADAARAWHELTSA
jgi:histidyl-tRNA synthetase